MRAVDQRAALARVAGDQWGLITTAQASAAGIPRITLTRMTDSGELTRVLHGVYATPAAAADPLVDVRAHWLALDRAVVAEQRLRQRHRAGVLSHATAASLHGVGDLLDDVVEVTLPARHQSRREGLRVHVAELEPQDVTIVDGLPVTTAARTIADLAAAGHDRDHVATVLSEAIRRGLTDRVGAQRALERRLGARGSAVFEELLKVAGLDEAAIVRQVAASPVGRALVSSAAQQILAAQYSETMNRLAHALARAMPESDPKVNESIGKIVSILAETADVTVPGSLIKRIVDVWDRESSAGLGSITWTPSLESPTMPDDVAGDDSEEIADT